MSRHTNSQRAFHSSIISSENGYEQTFRATKTEAKRTTIKTITLYVRVKEGRELLERIKVEIDRFDRRAGSTDNLTVWWRDEKPDHFSGKNEKTAVNMDTNAREMHSETQIINQPLATQFDPRAILTALLLPNVENIADFLMNYLPVEFALNKACDC